MSNGHGISHGYSHGFHGIYHGIHGLSHGPTYLMGHPIGYIMVYVLNHGIRCKSHVVYHGVPCPMTYPVGPMGPSFHGISYGLFPITSHGLRHDIRWPAPWAMPWSIHLMGWRMGLMGFPVDLYSLRMAGVIHIPWDMPWGLPFHGLWHDQHFYGICAVGGLFHVCGVPWAWRLTFFMG